MQTIVKPAVLVAALTTVAGLWLAVVPPDMFTPVEGRAAGLTVFTIGLLATAVVPEFLAAVLFFLAAMLASVAGVQVVFSGFQSAALWLVFGGMVVGVAVGRTGLGARLARKLTSVFGTSYLGIVVGVVAVSVALSFVMPSALGRVVLLTPIMVALAEGFGFEQGSKGYTGILLAMAFGNFMPAFAVLPANLPNMVLAGASESQYGVVLEYGSYFLLHFPVLGLLKAAVIVAMILLMFRDTPSSKLAAVERTKLSRDEAILSVVLVVSLGLWATDFLHHISPAWVALGAAAFCLLPGVGLVPKKVFSEKVNFGSFLYVAGVLGVGAVVADSGLGDLLAKTFLEIVRFNPDSPAKTFGGVSVLSALLGMATTQPGLPAVMAPLGGSIAEASGLSVEAVMMMIVVGFSTVILPYQAPPLVVAMQLGRVSMAEGIRFSLVLSAITFVFLLPLDYLWWRLLGWIG